MSEPHHRVIVEVPPSAVQIVVDLADAMRAIGSHAKGTPAYAVALAAIDADSLIPEKSVMGALLLTQRTRRSAVYALCGSIEASAEACFLANLCEHGKCRAGAAVIRAAARAVGPKAVFKNLVDQPGPTCSGEDQP